MRKVLGIASVFIMMLSVAAFANQFTVEESVLAAGAVDVEECGQVALTYNITLDEDELDTPDGKVKSVVVKGGDNCRYDDENRNDPGDGESANLNAPKVEVQLYSIDGDVEVIDSGDADFTTPGADGTGTTVDMDFGPTKVTDVDGVNVRIFDRASND